MENKFKFDGFFAVIVFVIAATVAFLFYLTSRSPYYKLRPLCDTDPVTFVRETGYQCPPKENK